MLSSSTKSCSYLGHIIVVSTLLLIVFSYQYWTLPREMMMQMGNYIQIITVFVLSVTCVITIMNFRYQIEDRNRSMSFQYTNLAQSTLNDVDKQFMSNPQLDRLYLEMYSYLPQVQQILAQKTSLPEETPDMLKAEHLMANVVFQKIADIYFCEHLDHTPNPDTVEWINTFRGWLKSPILLSHWQNLKYEQHPEVRQFVDTVLIGRTSK